ncbi:hypothetical protein RJ639_002974 [Escallonia herrerae]|uniref:PB1 domain-containing protein n=1 Tax=Escallonia herrerae TaxID=1293975 RepID=A0AA88W2X0_9ASTE|nr:hypothetical protein RJ639_002974 [Escallonia herrerae]
MENLRPPSAAIDGHQRHRKTHRGTAVPAATLLNDSIATTATRAITTATSCRNVAVLPLPAEETTPNHLPFPTAPSLSRSTPPSPLSSPPSNHSTHSLPPRSNSASPSSPSSRPTSPKALISVTNDDDLAHMMHEYDRLFRTSSKPARLRLFLFPVNPPSPAQSFGSSEDRSDRKRFMEALNFGPVQSPPSPSAVAFAPPGNEDFLFGSDKGMQLPFWIG